MKDLRHLLAEFPHAGRLEAIFLRPARGAPLLRPQQPMRLLLGEDVVLEVTGPCEPCSKMSDRLGPGAYNVLRSHGGVTARVLHGGNMSVGDDVLCRVLR